MLFIPRIGSEQLKITIIILYGIYLQIIQMEKLARKDKTLKTVSVYLMD